MSIVIKTSTDGVIDAGIHVVAECPTNPRNLMRAAVDVREFRAAAIRANGNVGHQWTRLFIDGVAVDDHDLQNIAEQEQQLAEWDAPKSRTFYATQLIERVRSGDYAEARRVTQAELDASYAESDAL